MSRNSLIQINKSMTYQMWTSFGQIYSCKRLQASHSIFYHPNMCVVIWHFWFSPNFQIFQISNFLLNLLFKICPSNNQPSYPRNRFRLRELLIERYRNFITNRRSQAVQNPGISFSFLIVQFGQTISLFVVCGIPYYLLIHMDF